LSVKEISRLVLASEPFRSMLAGVERLPLGRTTLTRLSQNRGVFLSFAEAWSAAQSGTHGGHDHPDAVKLHLELSTELRPSDYAVLFWLSRFGLNKNLRIFDFGGNAGNLYYSYSPYLEAQGKRGVGEIEWTVFDLPAVIESGRKLATERMASELRFVDSPAGITEQHVLLVSGAFHYWEKSVQAFLEQFSQRPAHILLNRTPVHDKQSSFITVQRTSSYAVPCLVRNVSEMMADFSSMDYTMIDRWPCLELSLKLPLYPDRSLPYYSGFCFRRD
jgi:putative methyltransferase (TIGR04325 family)